jgi:hypothetical protein
VSAFANPALKGFVAQIGSELTLAQVMISGSGPTFELRHISDRGRAAQDLRELALDGLRALAQFTASGAFRPLKSAPSLQTGWRFAARDEAELESALNRLYPGAVADWFAAQSAHPPVTNYRDFTGRQTGMYRVTTMLTDAQAVQVARACCHRSFCLKRRLWTVDELTPETVEEKSRIPCLEPCAVLLEFARKAARIVQEEKMKLELSPGEAATLVAALEIALRHPEGGLREADFNAPANPRRLQLLLEKLADRPITPTVDAEEQRPEPFSPNL